MGGSAIVAAAGKLREAIREAAAKRLGCAPGDIAIDHGMAVGPGRVSLGGAWRIRRPLRQRQLFEQQAHLQLRRPCRPRRGRSQDRPCRADRLRRRRGCRAHHQSADAARPDHRRHGAGAGRRVPRTFRLRRGRPAADRLARRLPDADGDRLSHRPCGGAGGQAVAQQSARRQGRGRGRHHLRSAASSPMRSPRRSPRSACSRASCRCRRRGCGR